MTDKNFGYLYIRSNKLFETCNACKLGVTSNIIDRASVYITGELYPGYYILVIKIPFDKMRIIEKVLQNYFKSLKLYIYYSM